MEPQAIPNTNVTPTPATPPAPTAPVQSPSAPVQASSSTPVQVGSPVTQTPPAISKMETMAQMSAAAQAAPASASTLRPEIKPGTVPVKPAIATTPVAMDSDHHTEGFVKVAAFALVGIVIGGILAAAYFMFLAPKPEPVTIVKIEEKVVVATATPMVSENMPPARTYSFSMLPITRATGVPTAATISDKEVFDKLVTLAKKESATFTNELDSILISNDTALVTALVPKDSGGENNLVIDMKSNKVTDKFALRARYYLDQGTFVFGADATGLSYYSYGASTSLKFANSTLTGNQTYVEAEGPMGFSDFKVTATTTNSITFGVYDRTKPVTAPGDDTAHYPKVGERTFILP